MRLAAWQSDMADRLRAPGNATRDRLGIYRRNVSQSLAEIIRSAYPVTRHAVGAPVFDGWAGSYVADHPPRRALLWTYGDHFAAVIAPLSHALGRPWLADLARLEWASQMALFAADAEPLPPDRLEAVPPEDIGALCFRFHPALHLIESDWPLHDVWQAWREGGTPPPLMRYNDGPRGILVSRYRDEVVHRPLAPWQCRFLGAMIRGSSLAEAVALCDGDDDVQGELAFLLKSGFCVGFSLTSP